MGALNQKIILALEAGLSLGLTYSPNRHYKILKALGREWKKIDEKELKKEIRNLYKSQLIEIKENPNGTLTYILSDKGKLKALTYRFEKMKIEREKWDGKWRVVIFDIPEKLRWGRDALREKLKDLGFHELQKSVFVFPYECKDEINFVIEFFNLRRYVRYGVLDFIDNDLHLKKIFKLI